MRSLRYFSKLLLFHGLGLKALAQHTQDCPDGLSFVHVQPEVIIGIQPVAISSVFSTDTVLTVGNITIPVTGAPTTLVTSLTLTETSTRFLTGDPEPHTTCRYTTLTYHGPGPKPTTITQSPSNEDPLGTVIVVIPSLASSQHFTGPYTTLTSTGSPSSRPTTIVQPPSGSDNTGGVIVIVPSTTQSGSFTGPYTMITSAGLGGSEPGTVTLVPSGTDATGTAIVVKPSDSLPNGRPSSASRLDVSSHTFSGTFVLPPSGSSATSRHFTGPYTNTTATNTKKADTTSTDAAGTFIVEPSTVTPGSSFTGPYTTISSINTRSLTTTLTLPLSETEPTDTVTVLVPSSSLPTTSITGPSNTDTVTVLEPSSTRSPTPGVTPTNDDVTTASPTDTTSAVLQSQSSSVTDDSTDSASNTSDATSQETSEVTSSLVSSDTITNIVTSTSVLAVTATVSSEESSTITSTDLGTSSSSSLLLPETSSNSVVSSSLDDSTSSNPTTSDASTSENEAATSSEGLTTDLPSASDASDTSLTSVNSESSSTEDTTIETPTNVDVSTTTGAESTDISSETDTPTSSVEATSISTASPTTAEPQTSSASECIPSATSTSSFCDVALPAGCQALETTNGILLVPVIAACTLALGPFAAGNIATCLATTPSLFTVGADIAECILTALEGRCITTLPDACTDLEDSNGLALVANVALCATALGPFAAGSAATCLATGAITSSTQGTSIVECLRIAFGFDSGTGTVTGSALCSEPTTTPPDPVCATIPEPCSDLADTNGLALIVAIPVCTAALGGFAVGNVATCLGTNLITQNTLGETVVECLEDALSETCITSLPEPCLDLAGNTAAQLVVNLPLCTAALGPFAAGAAATCLTSGLTNGNSVVDCLNDAIF
ncbi:hypothetical protein FSST1_012826 [Fusarium sambucinum]